MLFDSEHCCHSTTRIQQQCLDRIQTPSPHEIQQADLKFLASLIHWYVAVLEWQSCQKRIHPAAIYLSNTWMCGNCQQQKPRQLTQNEECLHPGANQPLNPHFLTFRSPSYRKALQRSQGTAYKERTKQTGKGTVSQVPVVLSAKKKNDSSAIKTEQHRLMFNSPQTACSFAL